MSKVVIYQILPRLFTNKKQSNIFNGAIEDNGCGKLNDIGDNQLSHFKELGCTHMWFTGILEHATCTDYTQFGIVKDNANVVKGKAGSPYAIKDYYDVDPDLAVNVEDRIGEFEALVERMHKAGLKVIVDFIPNHLARQYVSDAKPEGTEDFGSADDKDQRFNVNNNFYYLPGTSFKGPISDINGDQAWDESPARATGNDCFNPSPGINDWFETIKLNYGVNYQDGTKHFDPIPDTWFKMRDVLKYWASKGVDGFRCDMAELVPVEFWNWCIVQIKLEFPEIIFIAEVYQPNLYQSYIEEGGFDYLYDKVGFYDSLIEISRGDAPLLRIADAWKAIEERSSKMLFFMENHDELRLASDQLFSTGINAWPAFFVSAAYSSNPVMIYNGQEIGERGMDKEGYSGRDGRTSIFDYWSIDSFCRYNDFIKGNEEALKDEENELLLYYKSLLSQVNKFPALSDGGLYDLMWCNNNTASNKIFAWLRYTNEQFILLLANFSEREQHSRLIIPDHAFQLMNQQSRTYFKGTDILLGKSIIQYPKEVASTKGVGIRLKKKECLAYLFS
ncbi:alpha-amylase family glycosyl hydrolase [Carboxylicivirga sp. N1Y90]|uniref:alpha-amylase family glycosyl hydrolase n=1 Tax=Carboxylicivirga fragile TaxID=3417571 RepID=UPI003D3395CF|nr:alpha-amylase [Marinilabiliaceae bacterium N1Y90]